MLIWTEQVTGGIGVQVGHLFLGVRRSVFFYHWAVREHDRLLECGCEYSEDESKKRAALAAHRVLMALAKQLDTQEGATC